MDIFTLGIILIVLAGALCWVFVYMAFKKSFVLLIGTVFLGVIDMVACFGFVVGNKGLIHLAWAVPIAIVAILSSYYILARKVKVPIQHLTALLQKMSNKDLTLNVEKRFLKEQYEIKDVAIAVDKLVTTNRAMMKQLDENSTVLLSSSSNINASSGSISSGASEQASGIEEISTSVEEMTANIMTNSENANKSKNISSDAQKSLDVSYNKVVDAVSLMKKIDEHTVLVSQIASQTNILALNAAIEAAKAGDAGRGFAVVAKEVRSLAEQSTVAANQITQMTQEGVEQVNNVLSEITELVNQTKKSSALIQEVAAASDEMNIGANQINSAIQELNGVVQENAASSEELSATSEQLLSTAKSLSELVSAYEFHETQIISINKKSTKRKIRSKIA